MRITAKVIEEAARKINGDKKIIHLNQRNGYWAIDNFAQDVCYFCGLSTRESYMALKGIKVGLLLGNKDE